MTFTETLVAVMTDKPEIASLPRKSLIGDNRAGQPVRHQLPEKILTRIVRLQTMIYQEGEKSPIPRDGKMPEAEGQNIAELMSKYLQIQEDGARKMIMLKQLIVEIIREHVPAECERFNVHYALDSQSRIMRYPVDRLIEFD